MRKELTDLRRTCAELDPVRLQNVIDYVEWNRVDQYYTGLEKSLAHSGVKLESGPTQRTYMRVQTMHLEEIEAFLKERGIEYEIV